MVGCVISDIVVVVVKVDLFLREKSRRGVNWRHENRVTELPRKDSKQRGIIKQFYGRGREEKKRDDVLFSAIIFFFPSLLSNDICPTGWQWRGRPRAHQELVEPPSLRRKTIRGGLLCAVIYRGASLA